MAKKKMNIEEAMDIIKAIDGIYQLQIFANKISGTSTETDVIMDRFHEAVLIVDNYITMKCVDIVDGGKT